MKAKATVGELPIFAGSIPVYCGVCETLTPFVGGGVFAALSATSIRLSHEELHALYRSVYHAKIRGAPPKQTIICGCGDEIDQAFWLEASPGTFRGPGCPDCLADIIGDLGTRPVGASPRRAFKLNIFASEQVLARNIFNVLGSRKNYNNSRRNPKLLPAVDLF